MQKITQYISQLLTTHDCVIVPGLGGFVGNYQAAKIHPTSYIFNSPAKSIAFNVNLKNNDGLLVNTIASDQQVSLQNAEVQVKQFVDVIKDALHDHKPVKLPGIGRLTVDVENHIQFIPDNSQNFLTNSYGLYSFTAPPVLREKEAAIKHIEVTKIRPEKRKRSFSEVFLPVAAVLLLALITVQIYIQSAVQGYNYAEILGLNKLFNKEEVVLDRYKPVTLKLNNSLLNYRAVDTASMVMEEMPVGLNANEEKNPLPVINSSGTRAKYLLIAGALNTKEAAEKIIQNLSAINYSAFIYEKSGYQMVAVAVPDTVSPATFRELFIGDSGIMDAWVMRNK